MERLTKRTPSGVAILNHSSCFVYTGIRCGLTASQKIQAAIERLAEIEDILGDNYDLDHLRGIVEADRDGRCVVLPFAPGDEVWVVERDETGEPDCVSGYVFVTAAPGVALVHPFIGGSGDLQDILQDCLDNTEMSSTCDIEAYSLDDCYVSRKDAEAALEGGHNGKVLKPRGFAPAD